MGYGGKSPIRTYPNNSHADFVARRHDIPLLNVSMLLEIQQQCAKLRVRRIKGGELSSVQQSCGGISRISRDRDERHEHVTVCRMPPVRLLQQRQRVTVRAARIQRDGVDIGVPRIVRSQLTGLTKQIERLDVIALAHQKQAERMAD